MRASWQTDPARLRAWIPANLAGYGLGGALFGAVQASRLRHHFEVTTSAAEAARLLAVTTSTSLILFGALVGTGQWLALRRHLRAGWWIPATCLGWAVTGLIVGTVSGVAFGTVSTIGPRPGAGGAVVAAVTNCIVVGLLPASAQWLILRGQVPAGSWQLISLIGLALGLITAFAVVRIGFVLVVPWLRPEDFPSAKALVAVGAVTGLVYGAVTRPAVARVCAGRA
jgi:hypothetical protein